MINIAFIIGTRPEIVKCAPLYAALQEDKNFCPRIIATGQHREMADETFEAFGIIPQINLGIMRAGQSLTQVTQRALEGLDATVVPGELDAVIVHGDTASTLAGAIYAFQNRMPLIHVEAGLRSHHAGSPFPEEANRKLVGQIANLHLAPTEGARANLLREGIHSDAIFVTGNTVVDALQNFISNNRTPRSEQIEFIVSRQKPIIIASAHRREGWHDLAEVASALREIARLNDVSLVVPLHKNPIVREAFVPALSGLENVFLIEPLSYPEYVDLLNNSSLIISDSSGAEEEGPTLGIRTLVLRTVTERPEAVSTGVAKLTGRDLKSILNNATDALVEIHNQGDRVHLGQPYGDGNASARCVAAIAKYFGKLPADHIAYQWSII